MNGITIQPNQYSDAACGRVSTSAYLLAAFFLLLVPIALLVDLSLARADLAGVLPGDIYRLISLSEVFAHGLGVAMICLVVYALDADNRRCLYRIAGCALGAGLLADVIKLVVARQRPHAFLPSAPAVGGTIWDTFIGWLPHLSQMPDPGSHAIQSFPSAHTATAVAFSCVLAWRYPRGKWLFALFAIMAASQRILANAHYLSDTLAGAAVGAVVVGVSFDRRLARRLHALCGRDSTSNEKSHGSRTAA